MRRLRLRQGHRRQGLPVSDPLVLWMWGLVVLILIMGVIVFFATT